MLPTYCFCCWDASRFPTPLLVELAAAGEVSVGFAVVAAAPALAAAGLLPPPGLWRPGLLRGGLFGSVRVFPREPEPELGVVGVLAVRVKLPAPKPTVVLTGWLGTEIAAVLWVQQLVVQRTALTTQIQLIRANTA